MQYIYSGEQDKETESLMAKLSFPTKKDTARYGLEELLRVCSGQ